MNNFEQIKKPLLEQEILNNQTNEDESSLNKEVVSRRNFLGKIGRGLLGLTVLGPGVIGFEANAQNLKEEKINYIKELDEIMSEAIKEDTFLSKREIKEELENCGFIENINIQELEIKNPWKPSCNRDPLKESLDQSLSQKTLSLEKNQLNIIQTDFGDIGSTSDGALYVDEYKSIFINQVKDSSRKKVEKMENLIKDKAIHLEHMRLREILLTTDALDKENKIKLLDEEFENLNKNTKNITEISGLIQTHFEEIKKSLNKYINKEMFECIISKTNLPHEAFHYFFMTQLEKDGYQGPSVEELLAMAIRGKVERFGNKDPDYANISYDIDKKLDINNQEELLDFCKNINGNNELVSGPIKYSKEELSVLSDDDIRRYILISKFSLFLDEYLARIYNGALGNTPTNVKARINDYFSNKNDTPLDYNYEYIYHEPTSQELSILSQMKWKGTPILNK